MGSGYDLDLGVKDLKMARERAPYDRRIKSDYTRFVQQQKKQRELDKSLYGEIFQKGGQLYKDRENELLAKANDTAVDFDAIPESKQEIAMLSELARRSGLNINKGEDRKLLFDKAAGMGVDLTDSDIRAELLQIIREESRVRKRAQRSGTIGGEKTKTHQSFQWPLSTFTTIFVVTVAILGVRMYKLVFLSNVE
mmetsp:Transcript_42591/g.109565  ORF Transcript_42591/g.109565 Transcript_42591/m.109565 type:complete len:195 (+) Transcript_42591:913-1497(+)